MNILDIMRDQEAPAPGTGDRLEQIFIWQGELERKYTEIEEENGLRYSAARPIDLETSEGWMQLRDFLFRTSAELYEMTETLKNRPHKATHMPTDKNHFYEEFSDTLHFLIGTVWLLGTSPSDFVRYLKEGYSSGARDQLELMFDYTMELHSSPIGPLLGIVPYPVDLDDPKAQMAIKDMALDVNRHLMTPLIATSPSIHSVNTSIALATGHLFKIWWLIGMTSDDLYKVYWAKMEVNRFRQRTNY